MTSHPRISLPREHGAAITLAGALVAALALGPEPRGTLGAALAFAAAFVARGPLDRVAAGLRTRPWDRPLAVVLAAAFACGLALAATAGLTLAMLIGAAAAGMTAASMLAKRAHTQRSVWLESMAMAGLGGTAAIAAFAGGAATATALALGVVLAAHAAASVPLIRRELRGGAADSVRSRATAWAWIGGATLLLWATVAPTAAVALVPRALHASAPLSGSKLSAVVVGVRECVMLALAIVLFFVA